MAAARKVLLVSPDLMATSRVAGLCREVGATLETLRSLADSCLARLAAVDDLEPAIVVLDERGERLHPVAIVAIKHAIDVTDLGVVDMPAHHAIGPAPPGLARHRHLEVADVAHGTLDLELEVARQAPVGQPQARTQVVEPAVHLQRELVGRVPHVGQPLGALDHAVEVIAVRDP